MTNFKVQEGKVGSNFINLTITDGKGHEVELRFWQMPLEIIKKTVGNYGISLHSDEVEAYDEFVLNEDEED